MNVRRSFAVSLLLCSICLLQLNLEGVHGKRRRHRPTQRAAKTNKTVGIDVKSKICADDNGILPAQKQQQHEKQRNPWTPKSDANAFAFDRAAAVALLRGEKNGESKTSVSSSNATNTERVSTTTTVTNSPKMAATAQKLNDEWHQGKAQPQQQKGPEELNFVETAVTTPTQIENWMQKAEEEAEIGRKQLKPCHKFTGDSGDVGIPTQSPSTNQPMANASREIGQTVDAQTQQQQPTAPFDPIFGTLPPGFEPSSPAFAFPSAELALNNNKLAEFDVPTQTQRPTAMSAIRNSTNLNTDETGIRPSAETSTISARSSPGSIGNNDFPKYWSFTRLPFVNRSELANPAPPSVPIALSTSSNSKNKMAREEESWTTADLELKPPHLGQADFFTPKEANQNKANGSLAETQQQNQHILDITKCQREGQNSVEGMPTEHNEKQNTGPPQPTQLLDTVYTVLPGEIIGQQLSSEAVNKVIGQQQLPAESNTVFGQQQLLDTANTVTGQRQLSAEANTVIGQQQLFDGGQQQLTEADNTVAGQLKLSAEANTVTHQRQLPVAANTVSEGRELSASANTLIGPAENTVFAQQQLPETPVIRQQQGLDGANTVIGHQQQLPSEANTVSERQQLSASANTLIGEQQSPAENAVFVHQQLPEEANTVVGQQPNPNNFNTRTECNKTFLSVSSEKQNTMGENDQNKQRDEISNQQKALNRSDELGKAKDGEEHCCNLLRLLKGKNDNGTATEFAAAIDGGVGGDGPAELVSATAFRVPQQKPQKSAVSDATKENKLDETKGGEHGAEEEEVANEESGTVKANWKVIPAAPTAPTTTTAKSGLEILREDLREENFQLIQNHAISPERTPPTESTNSQPAEGNSIATALTTTEKGSRKENITFPWTTSAPIGSKKWTPYVFDCALETDERGESMCQEWAKGGLCEVNRATQFLFCRKTCLCIGILDNGNERTNQ